MNILDLLSAPWAILPERLHQIQGIYEAHLRDEQPDIPAIEARMGRPLANEQAPYEVMQGGVAVLAIDGVIAPKANLFTRISGGVSAAVLLQQLEAAAADSAVKSILQVIDSPGGSVHGTPEYAARVLEVGKLKPVVTLATANMASAAYWIGSAANAVFISGPTVLVGSIGVVVTHDYRPKERGQLTEITAGTYKRIASPEVPLTKEGRAYLQAQADHLYSVFVDAVAVHRGSTVQKVLAQMADGRVFLGQQALDAGLVDGIKPMGALLAEMARDPGQFAARRRAGQAAPARPASAPAPSPARPAAALSPAQFAAAASRAAAVPPAVPATGAAPTPPVAPLDPIDACFARAPAADEAEAIKAIGEGRRLYGADWTPRTRTRAEWRGIAALGLRSDGSDAYTAMHREGFIGQRSVAPDGRRHR